MKKFEVEVEIIITKEIQVWAESFDEAVSKLEPVNIDTLLEEGETLDYERRIIGVRRRADQRMYR